MTVLPTAFLAAVAAEPERLGWTDCSAAVLRWVAARLDRPQALALLPAPADFGAGFAAGDPSAWLATRGGLARVAAEAAEALGLTPTTRPLTGDVAHLLCRTGEDTMGIREGRTWVARTKWGVLRFRDSAFTQVCAWHVPQPRKVPQC